MCCKERKEMELVEVVKESTEWNKHYFWFKNEQRKNDTNNRIKYSVDVHNVF